VKYFKHVQDEWKYFKNVPNMFQTCENT